MGKINVMSKGKISPTLSALPNHVLKGKTFSTDGKVIQEGTMENRGIFDKGVGEEVSEGYYSGGAVQSLRTLTFISSESYSLSSSFQYSEIVPFRPSVVIGQPESMVINSDGKKILACAYQGGKTGARSFNITDGYSSYSSISVGLSEIGDTGSWKVTVYGDTRGTALLTGSCKIRLYVVE